MPRSGCCAGVKAPVRTLATVSHLCSTSNTLSPSSLLTDTLASNLPEKTEDFRRGFAQVPHHSSSPSCCLPSCCHRPTVSLPGCPHQYRNMLQHSLRQKSNTRNNKAYGENIVEVNCCNFVTRVLTKKHHNLNTF